jgi:predicted nucleotide-binding protein
MAKYKEPEARKLSNVDLQNAVSKIDRRITDLKTFDLKTITERFDAKIKALEDKINSTIADIFGHDTVEYNRFSLAGWALDNLPVVVGRKFSLSEVQDACQKGLNDAIVKLESLKDILQEKLQDVKEESYFPEPATVGNNSEVFIVHGHDEAAKQTVARFIEKLGLKPIILHEKPNEGHTIIEKFEKHSNVGFAVVLMTPDDVGAPDKERDKLKPRARQNVILELGFFLGKLGRKRVCALYKESVEIPSDYKGVLFIPMDTNDGWQLYLAKEIKAAGITVDLNKAI